MGIFVAMALGIVLGATIFPSRLSGTVSTLTLASTGLLIFCMGADLGAREELMGQLANLGFSSVVLCLAPVVFSIAAVYALTSLFMKDIVSRHAREKAGIDAAGSSSLTTSVASTPANTPAAPSGPAGPATSATSATLATSPSPTASSTPTNPAAPTAAPSAPTTATTNADPANPSAANNSGSEMVMIVIAVGSLALGVAYGISPLAIAVFDAFVTHSDFVLYALMFFVGISVGMSKGLIGKIREYGIRLLLVPAGIIVGSFAAGLVFAPLCGLSLGEGAAVTSGMGWYSLVGVVLADLAGPQVGSIAFLSNLLRELVSFLIIPWISRHLNYPTCIAPAGATSEDTTLPMIIRCTNEETVVLGVINGIVCSAAVPVLVAICSQFM